MLDVRRAEALGSSFRKLPNEVIISKGTDGCIPASAIDSFWSSKRQCLATDAIKASHPQAIVIPTPKTMNSPTHTDDDPSADFLVPLASDLDDPSPSRNSSPPAKQTKLGDRSQSRTATSKSSPPTPALAAQKEPRVAKRG